jgi:hypothetical protein
MAAQDQRIHNRGIIMTEVNTMDNGDLQGNIIIPNSAVNNQTTLVCIAKNVHPPEVNSNEVILQLLATQESIIDSTTTTSGSDMETSKSTTVNSAIILSRLCTVLISIITLYITT